MACPPKTTFVAPSAPARGFTLIEVLAAMTIFFMAIGILVTATSQALRLTEIERTEAVASRDQAMRLGWFRDSIAQTQIVGNEDPTPFKGDARRLSGITGQSLTAAFGGPGKYQWELSFDAQHGETELRIDRAQRILSWPGVSGQFRYLDADGQWGDQWPPFGLNAGTTGLPGYNLLPAAVMLEYGADRRVLVAAIQNRSLPPPTLKELLK